MTALRRIAVDDREDDLRIARFLFDEVARLSPDVEGVSRPAFSTVETTTLNFLEDFARREGLEVWYDAGRSGIEARARASWADIGRAFVDAVIPLGLPVIIFGGILGGVVTPTEAAVLAVLYAFIVGVFVYREIAWAALPGLLVQSAVVTAAVCFLLGTAAVVAWVLAVQQVPQLLLSLMLAVPGGNVVFLMLTAVLFILMGAVLEGLPAVVILLPTFMPVVTRLGIDVVHYSTVVVAATGIGLFLPPIGVGFFIACGIANIPGDRATPAMMPYVYMMCAGLLIVILVPWVTLIVPRLLGLG